MTAYFCLLFGGTFLALYLTAGLCEYLGNRAEAAFWRKHP